MQVVHTTVSDCILLDLLFKKGTCGPKIKFTICLRGYYSISTTLYCTLYDRIVEYMLINGSTINQQFSFKDIYKGTKKLGYIRYETVLLHTFL